MTLENSNILVVGGTKGIGLATVRAAQASGAQVTATGRSAASLAALPEGVAGAVLDFTKPASVADLADGIGALDHLVLTASSDVAWGPLAETGEDALRAAFEAKFWGYWRLIRALAPKLSQNGSITLVTGAAARAAMPGTSGLAAVNGALEALSKVLAVELAPLRINTVSPGMTATEAYAGLPDEAREGMFKATAAHLPLGRIGHPQDLAEAIVMVMANSFLTGATLDVDGGAHLAR
ncbi:SDR family oxidoreductase [Mameliella sediminis]|uniref:SDR family oxidoreductase n=1 Tax=Mameliella sediminis TaxID=2836866 RepID=UPI001C46A171|nr:SDR family oxidoreductase [Mameliella sediminis]MBV7395749.1 SDR family oxidoreductase [Mameliella sediminis]MBY6115300.1 SDR family oxidoreductase [Antarctobacter heliothermus]MBY6144635.1 SDR family oxidoreductase [Mameliella alba]MCA0956109.1 SDR family oxidoreductase [Mameliella alba]